MQLRLSNLEATVFVTMVRIPVHVEHPRICTQYRRAKGKNLPVRIRAQILVHLLVMVKVLSDQQLAYVCSRGQLAQSLIMLAKLFEKAQRKIDTK